MAQSPLEDDEDDHAEIGGGDNSDTVATAQLRAFVERIERMEEEKKAAADDIRAIYAEAKATASTRRCCARSCAFASRTPPSALSSGR